MGCSHIRRRTPAPGNDSGSARLRVIGDLVFKRSTPDQRPTEFVICHRPMNPPDSRILFHEVLKFGEDFLFPSINLILRERGVVRYERAFFTGASKASANRRDSGRVLMEAGRRAMDDVNVPIL